MEFSFTEEQKMIRDTAQAFLAEVSSSNAIRSAMDTEQGFDPQIWQRICEEMYWQAIHIPEEYGGMGLGYVDLVVMLEQMGRYLLCSPFFSTVCLASNALIVAGTDEQKQQYLTQICEGSLTATLAYTSKNGQWDATAVQGIVTAQGDDYVLNGTYRYVLDGHTAQLLIVAARSEGSEGEQGISLFAIDSDTPGVKRTWLPTMDQTRKQAEIAFDNVRVSSSQLMGEENNAWPQLNKVLQLAAIAIAAEQVGGSQQVLDLTVEYTKERVQFGRPIAGFQAVKHQAADMMLRTEVARSAVYYAACVAEEALSGGLLADELGEAASVAKSYCSEGYFKNAGDALQLHGGVGFTWEYDVHLYFKRAKSSELFLGDAAYHREHVATLLLD
ncbi:acyl-CoA dehydrogenase family protein [Pseudoalteromonas sp. SR45-4]|uniref:acyl-CoA dehydrogenase family protein n=1 Tax=Pseudoalteromonas sp. SR45-4 TaxID=2760929 RepID=UPI0015F8639A|nr:acyl-CoA dehydrogenase family protein [Pseudoalteromonas sp. SR45-4]MBB1370322.1 acyl-CoA/acyl-ACP dehydrogenase [Pseudoalteromonas sp. SR45-4]